MTKVICVTFSSHLSFGIVSNIAGVSTTSVSDATENPLLNCYGHNWFNRLFSTFLLTLKEVFFGGKSGISNANNMLYSEI